MERRLALKAILASAGLCVEPAVEAWEKALTGDRMQAQAGTEAGGNEIRIYGPIARQSEFSAQMDAEYGIQTASAASVQRAVSQADGGDLTVRFNSPGGQYEESVAIGSVLEAYRRANDAQLRHVVDGVAQSAAAFLFLRGDTRELDPLAMMMFHEIMSLDIGTAAQKRAKADELDRWNAQAAEFVAQRTDLTAPGYHDRINGKDWNLTAQQAVELGIGTGILDTTAASSEEEMPEAPDLGAMAHLQFAWARNAPVVPLRL